MCVPSCRRTEAPLPYAALLPSDVEITRFALMGDVQGYADRLAEALATPGTDPDNGVVPKGVAIVQVGDLVHKGPDSARCVALVERFLVNSPGRWVQLVGNHEAQYLGGTPVAPDLHVDVQSDLRRWGDEGQIRLSVAIDSIELGPVLVTHSGMTMSKWRAIGQPVTAAEAAERLNGEFESDRATALAAGRELDFGDEPGVVWADAGAELLSSWGDMEALPFSQVHGHSSPYQWSIGDWRPNAPRQLLGSAIVDPAARHTTLAWPDGQRIVGIDPGYGADGADVPIVPLMLTAA
jgi:hypothetical protein